MVSKARDSIQFYKKTRDLGSGSYGQVYEAVDTRSGQVVAIKAMLFEVQKEGLQSTSIREMSLLREIKSQHVIKLKSVMINTNILYLVLEYAEQDLKKYIDTKGSNNQMIQPETIKKFMYQLLSGIYECHKRRIIHRDLKPANILIDANNSIKIADFGLARTFSIPVRPYTHDVVTLLYRAPEILLGALQYSTPIDIWSLGCIFYQMITKKILFNGDSQIGQILKIFGILGTPNENNWPGALKLKDFKGTFPKWPIRKIQVGVKNLQGFDPDGLDLLNKLLTYDPNDRISAKEALNHVYFKSIIQ